MFDTLARKIFMRQSGGKEAKSLSRAAAAAKPRKVSKNDLITQINRAVTIRSVDRFASRKRIGHSKQTDCRGSGGSFTSGGSLCRARLCAII